VFTLHQQATEWAWWWLAEWVVVDMMVAEAGVEAGCVDLVLWLKWELKSSAALM
jgi:hypothetical protein